MTGKMKLINIEPAELLKRVSEFHSSHYTLAQIGCTKTDVLEINYSFDKDFNFVNLRITVPSIDIEIPSISSIYWAAFIYENEMSDLFGIKIKGKAIDYKGNFYRTTVKYPFNPQDQVSAGGGVLP